MTIRDRVRELRRVRAGDLRENPKNWRRHPQAQQDAMAGVLREVGFADALLAYDPGDGGLTLVDGHLRAGLDPDMVVPVLILDLNKEEADHLLLTLDPLAAMAQPDQDQLLELLRDTQFADQAVNDMLEMLANGELLPMPDLTEPVTDNAYTQTVDIPIYYPTGPQPAIEELTDRSTADELIGQIRQAELPPAIERFLLDAAERHVAFNFERIANYYAHAPTDIKALMERSALVIVDYDQAIANGFVRLKEDIDAAFSEDYPNA